MTNNSRSANIDTSSLHDTYSPKSVV